MVATIRRSHLARYPAHIQVEDLLSEGMLGLLRAIDCYNPGEGTKFETYAQRVVLGRMREYLRRDDWVPRKIRGKQRTLSRLDEQLIKGSRPVSDMARAACLSLTLDEFYNEYGEVVSGTGELAPVSVLEPAYLESVFGESSDVSSWDDPRGAALPTSCAASARVVARLDRTMTEADDASPYFPVQRLDERAEVRAALSCLLPRLRLVIQLYYYDGLPLHQVAQQMGVSARRVRQLHADAVLHLRAALSPASETACKT